MTKQALLDIIWGKIQQESQLPAEKNSELMQWVSTQPMELLEFLASDEFNYNEVHLHTEKSLLDGIGDAKEYHMQAVKLGHKAIAVTDHGVTYQWYDWRSMAKDRYDKKGEVLLATAIKPIFGCEIYLDFNGRVQHFLLLAENTRGYKNILRIVSESHQNKSNTSSNKPNTNIDVLRQFNEGVIATTACIGGIVGKHIQVGSDWEEIVKDTKMFAEIFDGRFYLEIQNYDVFEGEDELEDFQIEFIDKQNRINDSVVRLAQELNLPLIATNDCHYPNKGDHEVQEILLAIRTKDKLDNPDRFRFQSNLHYMKDKWEMLYRFRNTPQAVFNSWEIAKRCNVTFEQNYLLPDYPNMPADADKHEFFRKSVIDGVTKIYQDEEYFQPLVDKYSAENERPVTEKEVWDIIYKRASYETDVLLNMGFEGYIQIVSWINELARDVGILVGPGRGSAAGSIIALGLGITTVCPLRFDLLFERFMNPDRIEMPDVDVDYQYERRGELIGIVQQKIGLERVAQIVTFGKMKARAALRDVGRVLGSNTFLVDKLAKLIPFNKGLKDAMKEVPEFKQEYDTNPDAKILIDKAFRIENKPKNTSVHAAGIILSRDDIREHAAFQVGKKAIAPVIQLEMSGVDGSRLVKQDFLGLRNLSVISKTISLVKERTGIVLDPYKIPKNDKKTFELLASGNSIACFQLESQGMRQLLKDMQVQHLEDIVDCIALYRPGVLSVGMHNDYVKNKFNPDGIKYLHPSMESVLGATRGIMIYQEQAMLIANKLAGFSMSESDTLRKAIGKKNEDIMAKMKNKFVKGCDITTNIPTDTAEAIWHLIEVMASYSFNKSHSVAYAFISVDTAYLKANFPIEYMCSAISFASQGKSPKTPLYIEETKRMGIPVIAPDINLSEVDFSIKEDKIIFGLRAVRDVGKGAAAIVEERKANGPFTSIVDFRKRCKVNKKVVTALVKAGCFDSLGVNRYALNAKLEDILAIKPTADKGNKQQLSLLPDFGELSADNIIFPNIEGPSEDEIADLEIEMCGIYITHHPMSRYQESLYEEVTATAEELETRPDNALVVTGGMIVEKKVVLTKKKQEEMAILKIDDLTGQYDVVVFPRQYAGLKHINEKDIVIMKGRVQYREKFNSSSDDDVESEHLGEEKEIEYEVQIIADDIKDFKVHSQNAFGQKQTQTQISNTEKTQFGVQTPTPNTNINGVTLAQYFANKGYPTVKVCV